MKDLIIKYSLKVVIIATVLMPFSKSSKSQSKLQFSPENFVGNRSNNYQHIVNAGISGKILFTNFAYLDSDYQSRENLYNLRNTFSYNIFHNWSSNLSFGLKNPGLYSTISIQYGRKYDALLTIIYTGATYQKGFTSESFTTLQYTPVINNNLIVFIKATLSFNIDSKGVTRGIQQFRFGIKK